MGKYYKIANSKGKLEKNNSFETNMDGKAKNTR